MFRASTILAAGLSMLLTFAVEWSGMAASRLAPPPEVLSAELALERGHQACPEDPLTIHGHGVGRPDSWLETIDRVGFVVVARALAQEPKVLSGPTCLFWTLHPFSVERVIKGSLREGQAIGVQWGGRPIDVVVGFPRPVPGDRWLLFLSKTEGREGYHPVYGAQANHRIVDGRLVALEEGGMGDAAGRDVEEFVAELRLNMLAPHTP